MLNKIKEDQFAARKNREQLKATLLTTLYSEAQMVGKNQGNRDSTDEEVIKVIQKFLKGVNETITYLEKHGDAGIEALATVVAEKAILEAYLPRMASIEQVRAEVHGILSGGVDVSKIGIIMKMLSDRFGASLDKKMASSVINEFK